jgi:hypothetical protein
MLSVMNSLLTGAITRPWIAVGDYQHPQGWLPPAAEAESRARQYCEQLEQGEILFFTGVPFDFPQPDIDFLLQQRPADSPFHKNVSYRPARDVLRGSSADPGERERLHAILRKYSQLVTQFASHFLLPYAGQWTLDYASFRPLEEEGRALPLHKRNDLLHVDAFPTRPTFGARILRVFTNVSPKPRVWLTGERFTALAQHYAESAGLHRFASHQESVAMRGTRQALNKLGLPVVVRSPYDKFMLHFHDWLKENCELQQSASNVRVAFPPMCTWMVMTDTVPHAVLSGQYALEQTYIVPVSALVAPQYAPIRVLEALAGREMSRP